MGKNTEIEQVLGEDTDVSPEKLWVFEAWCACPSEWMSVTRSLFPLRVTGCAGIAGGEPVTRTGTAITIEPAAAANGASRP